MLKIFRSTRRWGRPMRLTEKQFNVSVDVTDAFFYRRSCDELLALETLTTSKTKAELFVIEGVVML